MANLSTGYEQLKSLSHHQRDQLLSQLLAEKAEHAPDYTSPRPPTPRSMFGKVIYDAATDHLTDQLGFMGIGSAVRQAEHVLENHFDDALCHQVDVETFDVTETMESMIISGVKACLASFEANLRSEISEGQNAAFVSKAAASVGHLVHSDSFKNMKSRLREDLPQLVRDSVTWRIDTSNLYSALSSEVEDFLMGAVFPHIVQNICDAELEMAQKPNASSDSAQQGGAFHG